MSNILLGHYMSVCSVIILSHSSPNCNHFCVLFAEKNLKLYPNEAIIFWLKSKIESYI